jgi:mannose-6-phosphate isomerase-like protein (cupin superfamily)
MNRVNQNDLPWDEGTSPKGTFRPCERDLVSALQAPGAGPPLPAGLPFDVALVRLPAGAANFPFHSHAAQWECYLILSGSGTVRHGDQRSPLRPGDCAWAPGPRASRRGVGSARGQEDARALPSRTRLAHD